MKKKILILIIITLFNISCSKIRDDATMVLCTSLETNPNLCSKTISKNYQYNCKSFYRFIKISPEITKNAAIRKSKVITSPNISHPKKIVNIGPSGFVGTGFSKFLETKESILKFEGFENWISKELIIRKTMRYVYNALARFPQYVNHVRALNTTECLAYKGANPERIEAKYGNLIPILVKSIQELQEKVQSLETIIQDLKK